MGGEGSWERAERLGSAGRVRRPGEGRRGKLGVSPMGDFYAEGRVPSVQGTTEQFIIIPGKL